MASKRVTLEKVNPKLCWLYTPREGYYSYANVGHAWARRLEELHLLAEHVDIANYAQWATPTTPVKALGIAIGPLDLCKRVLEPHRRKVLHIAPDTDKLPQDWVEYANEMDAVIVPSQWAYDVAVNSGVDERGGNGHQAGPYRIEIVRHGINPKIFKLGAGPRGGLFHTTTAVAFQERKGTEQLLRAYRSLLIAGTPGLPSLTVRIPERMRLLVDPSDTRALRLNDLIPELENSGKFTVVPGPSLPPFNWAELLMGLEAVVCPSRGEAFGMIPLEARACGTVPIMTTCTGHLEHFNLATDVPIMHGPAKPSWGNDPGLAPYISVYAIEEALLDYIKRGDELRQALLLGHNKFIREWSWKNVLAPLVKLVEHFGG